MLLGTMAELLFYYHPRKTILLLKEPACLVSRSGGVVATRTEMEKENPPRLSGARHSRLPAAAGIDYVPQAPSSFNTFFAAKCQAPDLSLPFLPFSFNLWPGATTTVSERSV